MPDALHSSPVLALTTSLVFPLLSFGSGCAPDVYSVALYLWHVGSGRNSFCGEAEGWHSMLCPAAP